jgi:copper chaperone CopZ
MKTSVMEVHNMLSVLSVGEVEKRIAKVPGVESVTVNYAGGNATVRYDETRLDVADIKSAVRQGAHESAAPAAALGSDSHEGQTAPSAPPTTAPPASPKAPGVAPATAGGAQPEKAVPDAMPSMTPKSPAASDAESAPTSTAQKSAPEAPAPAPATAAPADNEPQDRKKD